MAPLNILYQSCAFMLARISFIRVSGPERLKSATKNIRGLASLKNGGLRQSGLCWLEGDFGRGGGGRWSGEGERGWCVPHTLTMTFENSSACAQSGVRQILLQVIVIFLQHHRFGTRF